MEEAKKTTAKNDSKSKDKANGKSDPKADAKQRFLDMIAAKKSKKK